MMEKIFRPERDEATGGGEDYITRSFMIRTPQQLLFS
jgi:hypothetical protein